MSGTLSPKYVIDMDLLDFLPDGFQEEVDNGMPYKNYKTATKELTDSLYYILSVSNGSELINGLVNTDINEPFYNKNKSVVNGKYTNESYEVNSASDSTIARKDSITNSSNCGIDPAIIKVIKSKKYQNTLLATREFEERLKVIFNTCNSSVLGIYIKNLDKNLYILDSLAEIAVKETRYASSFHDFYLQKKTNVKNADKHAKLLQGYYEKELSRIKRDLQKAKEKVVDQLNKKNKEVEVIVNNYRKLLLAREKYRMKSYGFTWRATGWINIDKGIIPKTWGPQKLEISIQNAKQFDRIYTYAVYSTIKSIYRLNTDDKETFYVGNNSDRKMLMPERKVAFAIVVAYKEESAYLAIKKFETGTDEFLSMLPAPSTLNEIKRILKEYNKGYEKENKISEDLLYMDRFFIEQKRQKVLIKESEFIKRLWRAAFICCPEPKSRLGAEKIDLNEF